MKGRVLNMKVMWMDADIVMKMDRDVVSVTARTVESITTVFFGWPYEMKDES